MPRSLLIFSMAFIVGPGCCCPWQAWFYPSDISISLHPRASGLRCIQLSCPAGRQVRLGLDAQARPGVWEEELNREGENLPELS